MALPKVNTADEGSASGPKYTGLAIMDVIGVNPTKAQLEKIGIKPKDEPEYLTMKSDKDSGKDFAQLRTSFYMVKEVGEGESKKNIIVNHAIFLEARISESKAGNIELIDKFGKTCYASREEAKNKTFDADWMDKDSAKPAIVGESKLVTFFRNIANSGKDEELGLQHFCLNGDRKTLFAANGDAEIKACLKQVKAANGAKIKMLLGVRFDHEKSKSYQDVFPYNVGRVYADASYFHKELLSLNERKPEFFKSNYYGDIDFSKKIAVEAQYQLAVYDDAASAPAGKSATSAMTKKTPVDDIDDGFSDDTADIENAMDRGGSEDDFAF